MTSRFLERLSAAIASEFDAARFRRHAEQIASIEKTFCYRRFAESAGYCYDQLRALGLRDVQRLSLPADGRTAFLDFIMPQAWDAEEAALEIVAPDAQPIPLLDYPSMPLALANRCAPTPPEGIIAEVIPAARLEQVERAPGTFVYTEGQAPGRLRHAVAAKGALGMISDFSPAREVAPDETYWINGWCSPGWYQTRDHAPLTCFSIAPAKGQLLRERLAQGPVRVWAYARTRLYDGTIDTVTALLPGQEAREIILLAHIYEPFPCDDAVGAAALLEIGRTLLALEARGALPPRKVGIRLLIGMERYGFAQYFASEQARGRALLGISMDCICLSPAQIGAPVEVRFSPASLPFWGDLLLWRIAREALAGQPLVAQWGNLSDDTFISDRTLGVPSQWVWTRVGAYHHSSAWFRPEINDWSLGAQIAQLIARYATLLATAGAEEMAHFAELTQAALTEELRAQEQRWAEALQQGRLSATDAQRQSVFWEEWQAGRLDSLERLFPATDMAPLRMHLATLTRQATSALPKASPDAPALSATQAEASRMIPTRLTSGMPFSQARIPVAERMAGTHEQALNWADGRRNLLEIAARVGWETGTLLEDAALQELITYCRRMAQYGYLRIAD